MIIRMGAKGSFCEESKHETIEAPTWIVTANDNDVTSAYRLESFFLYPLYIVTLFVPRFI